MDEKSLLRSIRKNPTKSVAFLKGQPNPENAVAYCHNLSHVGYLSLKMMKEHECLRKQCPFFEKREHAYWEERAKRRADKKARKKARL